MAVNPACQPDVDGPHLVLKVDEMWGFVRSKANQRWLWWVEVAVPGRVVAFVLGRRIYQTFRRLLALLKRANFNKLHWLTDYYWAYIDCLPAGERIAGKAPLQSL